MSTKKCGFKRVFWKELATRIDSDDLAGNIDEKEDTKTSEITGLNCLAALISGWQVGAKMLKWDKYYGRLAQPQAASGGFPL